jgi:lipopolysaccharide transport system permease protein
VEQTTAFLSKNSQPTEAEEPDDYWTEVLRPRAKLLDIRFKEIWQYRDLLVLFVKRDFAAQFKQTVLGPLWHLIQPILTTITFMVLFNNIAGIPTDGVQAEVFYMSGIAFWTYFSTCLTSTSGTFVSNAAIFGKVYFPRLIIPLSVVASNVVKFGIQFGLVIAAIIFFHFTKGTPIYFNFTWLLIPFLLLMMAGLGLGLGIIISSVTTKYRDFNVLIGFGVQLLMYATPIVYPLSYLLEKKKKYAAIIRFNPLTSIVETFRYALFNKGTLDWWGLTYSFGFMVVILFIGLVIFNRVEKTFMDTV